LSGVWHVRYEVYDTSGLRRKPEKCLGDACDLNPLFGLYYTFGDMVDNPSYFGLKEADLAVEQEKIEKEIIEEAREWLSKHCALGNGNGKGNG
jgi:hypothetical protein